MISARKLQQDVNYKEWRNFNSLVLRAKNLISNGVEIGFIKNSVHQVIIGSGARRLISDYELDNNATILIKKLALSYKLGKSYSTRNETAIFGLLQKYCVIKCFSYDFQFRIETFLFDFRCENILFEFDEPHHKTKRQRKIDFDKDRIAVKNGFSIFRPTLENDIVDIIHCVDINVRK